MEHVDGLDWEGLLAGGSTVSGPVRGSRVARSAWPWAFLWK